MKFNKLLLLPIFAATGGWIWFSKNSDSNQATDKNKQTPSLSLGWAQAPRSFDPRYAIDAESQYLENLMHCSLINFDASGSTTGDLAQKWIWEDSKTLKVLLNKEARFSDGSAVTSADVKAVYDFFLKKEFKTPSARAGAFMKLSSVSEDNEGNIIFKLKEPDSTFVTNLVIGILPKKYVTDEVLSSDVKVPGCGPYHLSSADLNTIVLEENKFYSLSSKPKTPLINIRIVKDETTRLAKLRNGEIDIAQNNISREKVAILEKEYPQLKLQRTPGLKTTYLGFNTQDNILSSPEVRKAISSAIDRKKIIRYLLKDLAIPATTMLPPDNFYFNEGLNTTNYDPALSENLLEKSGFNKNEQGFRFTLSYKTTNDDTRIAIAKSIASDLSKIGIKVNVQALEWGRFKDDVDNGRVQLWSLIWMGFKDPDIYRYAFATESFPPNGGNRGRYSNPELDQLLLEARMTTDKNKRKSLYDHAQKIISDEAPYAFLFHEENFVVLQKDIEGFQVYADGRYSSLKDTIKVR